MTIPLIGVSPPAALASRERLFRAVAQALDVQFVERAAGRARVAAEVSFEEESIDSRVPSLVLGAGHGAHVDASGIRFAHSGDVDGHLRGWVLPDDTILGVRSLIANREAASLADVSGSPVWTTQSRGGIRVDHAVLVPDELGHDETLRSRLVPGRFFGLLPMIAFLRSLDRGDRWYRPPVRASFVMDDPNLHSARYGYIDFERVADDAMNTDFALSVATIPLDGWFISGKAASIFKRHPDRLSLLIHGNNHTRHELARVGGEQPRLQMIAQALRRAQRFEARSGIPIARVMVPPHGRCSEQVAWDMARLGMESLCITRSFPWRDRAPSGVPLAGWFPADTFTPMPVVERMPLTGKPEEIPLRAFLGQPIVLYGHDSDLATQAGLLASWAGHVARLDEVSWAAVGDISRNLVSWRSDGETLLVRPHTRSVDILVPAGVSRLVVEGGGLGYETAVISDRTGAVAAIPLSENGGEITVSGGQKSLNVRMVSRSAIDPNEIPNPRWSPWPVARRLLTEARDRTRPWVDTRRGQ